jgi:cytochrome c oxidase assembly protein subunit 11
MMKPSARNYAVFASCFVVVFAMVGATYAAVPLYYILCRATGYGGTPNRANAAPGATGDREITVRFDANVDPHLPWIFEPEQRSVRVKVGEEKLVYFRAENRAPNAIVGHASFNVAPDNVAHYFDKIQCFCFTEQTLEAGESVHMPVVFFIAPAFLKDKANDSVDEIALSYTFYPAVDQAAVTRTVTVAAKRNGG